MAFKKRHIHVESVIITCVLIIILIVIRIIYNNLVNPMVRLGIRIMNMRHFRRKICKYSIIMIWNE